MVTAADVGAALNRIAVRLADVQILTREGQGVLSDKAGQIKRGRDSTAWSIAIDSGRPLTFSRFRDKNGREVTASMVVKVSAAPANGSSPPFDRLDMVLLITDVAGEPVARWHLDLANEGPDGPQEGPLFHLQYGGHNPGMRHLDHPLKGPRWCHPPMEVGLFCEVVAANFFHETWRRELREDAGWCSAVRTLQKLCYGPYVAMMAAALNGGNSTALATMWADRWRPAVSARGVDPAGGVA